jgi:hypothetical protein
LAALASYSTLRGAFSWLAGGLVRRRRLRVPVVIGAVVHGNACASESSRRCTRSNTRASRIPVPTSKPSLRNSVGHTGASVQRVATQRTVVRGAVGQVRVVGRPRAAMRFALLQRRRGLPTSRAHLRRDSRSSAPGLALTHLRRGAGAGTGAAQAGSCQHASPCCNTVHCVATRCTVLQHGALCCNTACSWTCHVQRDG